MSGPVFIHLESKTDVVAWQRLEADGSIAASGHGALVDVAESIVGSRVVVIVPGEDVLLCGASVPGQKRRLLAQALPYVLEEQLVDDVEELHFAIGKVEDDKAAVAVVRHDVISAWLEQLRDAGIEPYALVPETLVLPLDENQWSLLCQSERCLLRTGPQAGLAMDKDNASALLSLCLSEAESSDAKLQSIKVYDIAEAAPDLSGLDIELQQQVETMPPLNLMASVYDENQVINLLQGQYSRRGRVSQYWRPWRVAASMVAVWLIMQVVVSVMDYQRLNSDQQTLQTEIIAAYKQAFPEARNIPNPRVQMERALKSLRGGGSAGAGGFSELLTQVGKQFKDASNIKLQRVSYKDGLLDVGFLIDDLQQLDQLKQKLISDGQLQVDIQSASARGDKIDARLRIKGRAS
jgi:general secretion pathway protein L